MDELRFAALGGDCELFAVDAEPGRLREAESWIHRMHDRLTRFDAASELSRLNAAAGRWEPVSAELEALLRRALAAWEESGGLVHVAVLPALVAAGYGGDFDLGPTPVAAPPGPLPPLPALLEVRPRAARVAAGAAVDLGGIAKGWLADRLVERLGPNSLANLAGDLYARGPGTTGDGWPVGFGGTTVLLRDLGAATSGVTKRRWGAGLHHLIDPRTGRPAIGDLSEVSVLARSGTDAEVYAKAALLLGAAAAPAWLAPRSLGWDLVPAGGAPATRSVTLS